MRKFNIILGSIPLLFTGHGIGASTICTEIAVSRPTEPAAEVVATVYYPTGRKTASGHKTPEKCNLGEYGWIAVSRDLLKGYAMGDTVLLEGISTEVDGTYIIRDKTHRRFRKRIDILVRKGQLRGVWNNVKMTKVSDNAE